MKLSKVLSLAVLLTFFAVALNAQKNYNVPKYKNAIELKNRQLIILINSPNQKVVDKLTKKGWTDALQEYQKTVADYNANMKENASKFWTFNTQPILYKTHDELKEMMSDKSQRDKYVIIYCHSLVNGDDFDWRVDDNGKEIKGTATIFAITFSLNDSPFYNESLGRLLAPADDLRYYFTHAGTLFNCVLTQQKDCK